MQLPALAVVDPSYTLLGAVLLGIVVVRADGRAAFRHPLVWGPAVLAGLAPIVLHLTGKYPAYYAWMAFIPLVVSGAVLADRVAWNRWGVALGGAVLAGVIAVGLPARAGVAVLQWEARSYAPVTRLVEQHVAPSDTVFTWYAGYSTRQKGKRQRSICPNTSGRSRPPRSESYGTSINSWSRRGTPLPSYACSATAGRNWAVPARKSKR